MNRGALDIAFGREITMKEIQWKTLAVTDTGGTRIPVPAGGGALTLRMVPVETDACRGYAGYVSLDCAGGMSGSDTAVLVPECEDAGAYLAIVNHSPYWCRPFWGDSLRELPARTQELLLEGEDGYICWLPVCAGELKTVLQGGADGMELSVSSNLDGMTRCPEQLSFLCMEGKNASGLLHAIAKTAAGLLGNGLRMREERAYPEVLGYLGWCSWDAFQIRVSRDGLLEKAREFREKRLPVHYAIIDDMWADVPGLNDIPEETSFGDMVKIMHASRLRRFEGDPVRFPGGMQSAIAALKAAGIPAVGVWFPTTGYWSGMEPGGEAERELADLLVTTEKGLRIPSPEHDRAGRYFDVLCGKARAWGADFVKIDNQGFHRNYHGLAAYGRSAAAIQSAIDGAAERQFGGAVINCMGMPNECLFHRTKSAVCRCSDDFMPESREWFAKNILQCAYNGLLQGQYQVNDWDMWWTDDEQAVKNSLCRAVSGGPIYISDRLGRTRPEVLSPLTLSDGRILRCDLSAAPTDDCLMHDPTKEHRVFKIRNRAGESGILAAFHISAESTPVKGFALPEDCGLPVGSYAWYEYFTRAAGILPAGGRVEIELAGNDDFRLYTFVPMPADGVAVLGRTDLFIGVRAACRSGDTVVLAEEGGRVGLVSAAPVRVMTLAGAPVPVNRRGVLTEIIPPKGETVLRLQ